MESKNEYVYLLREREFIKTNESIYKIGKTRNIYERMSNYPKNSDVIITMKVKNCDMMEKEIMKAFDDNFKQEKKIGREYYNGNEQNIKKKFCDTINTIEEHNEIYINSIQNKRYVPIIDDTKFTYLQIFESKSLNELICECLNCHKSAEFAKIFYYLHKNDYDCNIKKIWHKYEGNKIIKINNDIEIRSAIMHELKIL